jgi:hypothetical protein
VYGRTIVPDHCNANLVKLSGNEWTEWRAQLTCWVRVARFCTTVAFIPLKWFMSKLMGPAQWLVSAVV